MNLLARNKSRAFTQDPFWGTYWPCPSLHSSEQPGKIREGWLFGQLSPMSDKTDAGWSVIPLLCFGSSHTLQTVWNSLRQENRLTVIFQVLFSRSFEKNKFGHVGMLTIMITLFLNQVSQSSDYSVLRISQVWVQIKLQTSCEIWAGSLW